MRVYSGQEGTRWNQYQSIRPTVSEHVTVKGLARECWEHVASEGGSLSDAYSLFATGAQECADYLSLSPWYRAEIEGRDWNPDDDT